jgi:hypothetical protein
MLKKALSTPTQPPAGLPDRDDEASAIMDDNDID